jgi:L-threonylcarbamoyladenylate synthase
MRVLAVDARAPEPDIIAEAVRVLRGGGLVAFPTETVYGLGARALDANAIERIFVAKGRPRSHPLIAHVEGEAQARTLALAWNERASALARAFWPGPLTLVVPRAAIVPDAVTGGGDSVAVRAPAHPVARALLAALGEPIVAPSANRFQGLSPTRAAHVVSSLGDADVLVLDGGACSEGIESTVVDVRGARPSILRRGTLSREQIARVLPDVGVAAAVVGEGELRASPGMDARHYAPRAKLHLVPDAERAQARVDALRREGRAVVLATLPARADAAARELYAILHALDDEGYADIVMVLPPAGPEWEAIADRLRRAAT